LACANYMLTSIRINKKIIERHRLYIKNSTIKSQIMSLLEGDVLIRLENKYGGSFKEEHVSFCKCLLDEYRKMDVGETKNIFIGKPCYLNDFIEMVKTKYKLVHEIIIAENESYSKLLYDAFGYNKFVHSHGKISKRELPQITYNTENFEDSSEDFKWGAYAYVLALKIKVCPYCNRNYITPIYSETGKMRADLDHFFAKCRYPYLSISLFNLVPSCKYCNSSLKGIKEFIYEENFHPLDEIKANDLYRITYIPRNMSCFWGEENLDIELNYNKSSEEWKKMQGNDDILKIREVYQYHKDVVSNLLKKRYVYDEGYIMYLQNTFPNLFASKKEVVEFLVAQYDISQIENAPLGKMMKDLIEEMDF